MEPHIKVYFIP